MHEGGQVDVAVVRIEEQGHRDGVCEIREDHLPAISIITITTTTSGRVVQQVWVGLRGVMHNGRVQEVVG